MESGEGGFLQTSQGKKLPAKWVRISISAQQCNTSQCIAFHNIALHFKGLHKRIIGINIIGATTPARCGQLVVIGRIPRYCFYLRCFTAVQWSSAVKSMFCIKPIFNFSIVNQKIMGGFRVVENVLKLPYGLHFSGDSIPKCLFLAFVLS